MVVMVVVIGATGGETQHKEKIVINFPKRGAAISPVPLEI